MPYNPNAAKFSLPQLTTAQIKAGDKIIREEDHLSRHDHAVTVKEVNVHKGFPRSFILDGYWKHSALAKELCAEGYSIVERNGQRIGRFFAKYW